MAPDRPPDPLAVAIAFAEVCDRLGIRYLAAGSLASSVHGEPRSTDDVDFVADIGAGQVDALVAQITPEYYVDRDTVREAVLQGQSFNAIHLATAVKVDVFVAGTDPFEAERLERRRLVEIWPDPRHSLFVDIPEYTVVRKLEWYRRGGEVSDRQWRDVVGVLRTQGDRLDRTRMIEWAGHLGVPDLLHRAIRDTRG